MLLKHPQTPQGSSKVTRSNYTLIDAGVPSSFDFKKNPPLYGRLFTIFVHSKYVLCFRRVRRNLLLVFLSFLFLCFVPSVRTIRGISIYVRPSVCVYVCLYVCLSSVCLCDCLFISPQTLSLAISFDLYNNIVFVFSKRISWVRHFHIKFSLTRTPEPPQPRAPPPMILLSPMTQSRGGGHLQSKQGWPFLSCIRKIPWV